MDDSATLIIATSMPSRKMAPQSTSRTLHSRAVMRSPSAAATFGLLDHRARQWDTRAECNVRQILDRVADKWSLLAIALLDRRSMRFTELRKEIDGISQRMLTVTLRHLERDGLVSRTIHPVIPPRVEYALTPLGISLHDTIQALLVWTEDHQNEIADARIAYDDRVGQEQLTGAH